MDKSGKIYWPPKGKMPRIKRYLDELDGKPATSIWSDIPSLSGQAAERLGYPTQKPLALLERIIQASSNPDSWILDSFCGCGTAIAAAQKLGRKWIGIDITHLSIALQKYRLEAIVPGNNSWPNWSPISWPPRRFKRGLALIDVVVLSFF